MNFSGLAQASAAIIEWPIADSAGAPIAALSAAKLELAGLSLTLGSGLSFAASTISADLTNARTADLSGPLYYELWIQIGPDKLASVCGTIDFKPTRTRI